MKTPIFSFTTLLVLLATPMPSSAMDPCALFATLLNTSQHQELDLWGNSSQEAIPIPFAGFQNFALVVTENNRVTLALTPYLAMNAHGNAINEIKIKQQSNIRWVLGSGELRTRPDGVFDQGNETSGYVFEKLNRQMNRNSIVKASRIIRSRAPELIAPEPEFDARPFPQEPNGLSIHLDPRLGDPESPNGLKNIRHDGFLNLQVLVSSIELLVLPVNPEFPLPIPKILERMSRNTLSFERLLGLFEVNGQINPSINDIRLSLSRIRNQEALTSDEYQTLKDYFIAIRTGLSNPTVRLIDLGEWTE